MMDRDAILTAGAPAPIGPYSQAIHAGSMIFLSGQIPLDPVTGAIVGEDAASQAEQVMRNIGAVLAAAGLGFDDLARTTIFLKDLADFPAVNAVYASHLSAPYPARSTIQAAALPRDVLVEIDAIALVRDRRG